MVSHRSPLISILILVLAFYSVPSAGAGPPTDQLRSGVDRVFKILKDPELEGETRTSQRRSAIMMVAHEIFDFGEMAKRSLGPHWNQRTPAERGEFVRLFTDLIQRSYVSKVDQRGSPEMIVLSESIDGDQAVVRTTLPLDHGRQIPLDYKMHNTNDRWRVYDLSIDGISLVGNYRAQFNKVIRTESYGILVAKLKARQAEFSEPSAAPAGVRTAR
jgi:phospholipid transport system substrate-binding protein